MNVFRISGEEGGNMSYAEFPGTCMGDSDKGHAELIALYKELVSKYSETLGMIKEVNDRLTAYENTMNQRVTAAVGPAVTAAVGTYKNDTDNSIAALAADNANIRNIIAQNDINIRTDMQTLKSQVNTAISTIDTKVDNTQSALTQSNTAINNRIDYEVAGLNSKINSDTARLTTKIDTGLESLDVKLTEEIERVEKESSDSIAQEHEFTLTMLDIIQRKFEDEIAQIRDETSADSIRWLWQYGCDGGGFSVLEWYFASNITCGDWQQVSPSVEDWYTMGRHLFRKFDQSNKMFDPVTGRLSDVRKVIENLSIIMKDDAITAEEYDKRKITAGHYTALNEKAFCYDWKGDKNVQ